jgi:hypothetical protein
MHVPISRERKPKSTIRFERPASALGEPAQRGSRQAPGASVSTHRRSGISSRQRHGSGLFLARRHRSVQPRRRRFDVTSSLLLLGAGIYIGGGVVLLIVILLILFLIFR